VLRTSPTPCARDAGEVAEAAVDEPHAVAEAREAGAGARERVGIGIEAEQANVLAPCLQHRLRVSAHAHRPIDHPALAARSQQPRDLVHEDGNVNR